MARPQFKRWLRRVGPWLAVSVIALALRVALIPLSPRYGYYPDHDDFVRWGLQAADEGVLSLYDHAAPRQLGQVWRGDKWRQSERTLDRLCNYPPLSAYLLWGSGKAFAALSDDRLINTTLSRAVFASWVIVGDFVLAWGCASLVAFCRPGRAGWWAYVIALLAPPLWWDSVVWGQVDTVALAPAVWMLRAMVARRWVWAGVAYGVLAALKPQAVLFVPVWALAVFGARPWHRPVLALVAAAAVFLLAGLPFTLHGGWTWLDSSYIENLLKAYKATSKGAFNLWYVDLLSCDSLDAGRSWLGIEKDIWGKVFLLLGLGLSFVWMVLRWRQDRRGPVLWATLSLLLFVMLPTRVHERYLLWVLPFALVAALWWGRLWPAFVLLTVVATAQVTWPVWLKTAPGEWSQREKQARAGHALQVADVPESLRDTLPSLEDVLARGRERYVQDRAATVRYEWVFTILGLLGGAVTVASIISIKPPAPRPPPRRTCKPPGLR